MLPAMGRPTKSPASDSSWWARVRARTGRTSPLADPATAHGTASSPANRLSRGNPRAAAVALVAYAVLAVALFFDTWRHPTTWSIGVNTGDPQQAMWFLSWPMFAISHGSNLLFTNYQYFPSGVNLMWNTSILLPALALSLVTVFGGPVLAYNVLATAALALSAWTAFILIRRFTSNQVAAAVGATLYGFSPFMTAHSLAHPNLTAAFMPPLLLLLVDELLRVQIRPPVASGLLLGLAGVAQLLIAEELLVTTAILATLIVCLAVALRPDQVRPKLKHALLGLTYAVAAFMVLAAAPLSSQFLGPQRLPGLVHPLNVHVSDALSFFVPTRLFLLAPDQALALSDKFSGGVAEVNSYVGVLLVALLAFIAVRYWRRLIVRLAAMAAALIAILSMGQTIHYAGNTGSIPVFALGLAFPLLQRFLPGRLMLYLTFLGWLGISQLPVINNILPTRLMLYFYLLAGLMLAIFLDDLMAKRHGIRALGFIATAVALLPLVPAVPYLSSPEPVPAFFAGGSASRIPAGSVALVVPLSYSSDGRAMLWQAAARMQFRMPEGYALIPESRPEGSLLNAQILATSSGEPIVLPDWVRHEMLTELELWQVKTVIVGPMIDEQYEVELFTSLFNRPPQQAEGVYVWWNVDEFYLAIHEVSSKAGS
jgi:hypothetical protein